MSAVAEMIAEIADKRFTDAIATLREAVAKTAAGEQLKTGEQNKLLDALDVLNLDGEQFNQLDKAKTAIAGMERMNGTPEEYAARVAEISQEEFRLNGEVAKAKAALAEAERVYRAKGAEARLARMAFDQMQEAKRRVPLLFADLEGTPKEQMRFIRFNCNLPDALTMANPGGEYSRYGY